MGKSARNGLKAFDRVRYVGLPHKLKFYDIFLEVALPYFVFLNDGKRLITDLDRNSSSNI